MIPGTIPIPASVNPILTYRGSAGAGVSSSFSFTGCDFGPAASDRYIIVTYDIGRSGTFSVDPMTVGGVTATLAVAENSADGNRIRVAVLMAPVPTGTTGTIAVNTSAVVTYCIVSWYSVTGLSSATPVDTGSDDAGQTLTTTMDVTPGGIMVGVAGSNNSGSVTWSGLTKDIDSSVGGTDRYSSASESFVSGATGLTVSATMTTNSVEALAVASWR